MKLFCKAVEEFFYGPFFRIFRTFRFFSLFSIQQLMPDMIKEQYTKAEADRYRRTGDAPADEVIAGLLNRYGEDYAGLLVRRLGDDREDDFFSLDPLLTSFYQRYAERPALVTSKELIRATDFYRKHRQEAGLVLVCYALPYCYLTEDGARVLRFSARLEEDTWKRLKETGAFLSGIMNFEHWQSGRIYGLLLKVRLMHALVRHWVHRSGKWNEDWGVPVNQEDMAGTILAFSYIVIKGLRKTGVDVDEVEERAWMKVWAAAGLLLGVDEPLLAGEYKKAMSMDKHIAARHFRPSETGKALTGALIRCFESRAGEGMAAAYLTRQMRFLLGDTHADWLGVPQGKMSETAMKWLNQVRVFISQLNH